MAGERNSSSAIVRRVAETGKAIRSNLEGLGYGG